MNQTKNSTTTLQEFQQKRTEKNKEENYKWLGEKFPSVEGKLKTLSNFKKTKLTRDIYSGFLMNEFIARRTNLEQNMS